MSHENQDGYVSELLSNGSLLVDAKNGFVYGSRVGLDGKRKRVGYTINGNVTITVLKNGRSYNYPVARIIYLAVNGRVPSGNKVVNKDGDKGNNKPGNLGLVPLRTSCGSGVKRWSAADINKLRNLWPTTAIPKLAKRFGRSSKAIQQKLEHISAPGKKLRLPWSKEDDERLRSLYSKKLSLIQIAGLLGRTAVSVRLRGNRILGVFKSDPHLRVDFRGKNFYQSLKSKITCKSAGGRCCLCSYEKHIELHHIDGNSENHAKRNIAALCPNHHTEVEAGEHDGKKLWCIWWRIYSDGSKSEECSNSSEVK